jgi:hypothetical protein
MVDDGASDPMAMDYSGVAHRRGGGKAQSSEVPLTMS